MTKSFERVREIIVDTQVGKDRYHIVIGSKPYNSHIYRNGEELKTIRSLFIDVSPDKFPLLRLEMLTTVEEPK